MSLAVSIRDMSFGYEGQSKKNFSHLDLSIAKGERFGIFGPNGAGKTTLMNLMTGLLDYTTGSVKIFDKEIKSNKKSIHKISGFVPQDFSFYHELSPEENLQFFGAWSGLNKDTIRSKTKELLEILGLWDVRNKPVQEFSGGMKRRVNLAIAVLNEPAILFLDEPTVGVDVQTRHAMINYLKELNAGGTTLVYTSHQLSEAEDLCNTIALIDDGKIIANNSLENLLSEHRQEGLEGLFLNLTGKEFRD